MLSLLKSLIHIDQSCLQLAAWVLTYIQNKDRASVELLLITHDLYDLQSNKQPLFSTGYFMTHSILKNDFNNQRIAQYCTYF